MTGRPLQAFALLCLQALGTGPIFAQTTPSAFQSRVEEVARSFENNPRFKGLSQQQRVDRVEFVFGNTLFILLHEMGHVYIHELRLPVLGREEDAADTFAVVRLLKIGSDFSQRVLVEAAKGWFFSDRRDRQTGAALLYYDEHGLNQQRAYQIVCLMVGSDPVKYKELADESKLPASRRESCKNDYTYASWSWETVLAPHLRAAGQPPTKIDVVYGDGKGSFDDYARSFRSIRLLETLATGTSTLYAWPSPFTLEMRSCGIPDAGWDDVTRILKVCYELPFDFSELYRAYGTAPLIDPPRNAQPSERKRKAK